MEREMDIKKNLNMALDKEQIKVSEELVARTLTYIREQEEQEKQGIQERREIQEEPGIRARLGIQEESGVQERRETKAGQKKQKGRYVARITAAAAVLAVCLFTASSFSMGRKESMENFSGGGNFKADAVPGKDCYVQGTAESVKASATQPSAAATSPQAGMDGKYGSDGTPDMNGQTHVPMEPVMPDVWQGTEAGAGGAGTAGETGEATGTEPNEDTVSRVELALPKTETTTLQLLYEGEGISGILLFLDGVEGTVRPEQTILFDEETQMVYSCGRNGEEYFVLAAKENTAGYHLLYYRVLFGEGVTCLAAVEAEKIPEQAEYVDGAVRFCTDGTWWKP